MNLPTPELIEAMAPSLVPVDVKVARERNLPTVLVLTSFSLPAQHPGLGLKVSTSSPWLEASASQSTGAGLHSSPLPTWLGRGPYL